MLNFYTAVFRNLISFAVLCSFTGNLCLPSLALARSESGNTTTVAVAQNGQHRLTAQELKGLLLSPIPTLVGIEEFFRQVQQSSELQKYYSELINNDPELKQAVVNGSEFRERYRQTLESEFPNVDFTWITTPFAALRHSLENWNQNKPTHQTVEKSFPFDLAERQARSETANRYRLSESALQTELGRRGSLPQSFYQRRLNQLLMSPYEVNKPEPPLEQWRKFAIERLSKLRAKNLKQALEMATKFHNPTVQLKEKGGEKKSVKLSDLAQAEIIFSPTPLHRDHYQVRQVGGFRKRIRRLFLGDINNFEGIRRGLSGLQKIGYFLFPAPQTTKGGSVLFKLRDKKTGLVDDEISIPTAELPKIFVGMRLPWTANLVDRKKSFEKIYVLEAGTREENLSGAVEIASETSISRPRQMLQKIDENLAQITQLTLTNSKDLTYRIEKESLTGNLDALGAIRWNGFSFSPAFWAAREASLKQIMPNAPTYSEITSGARSALNPDKDLNSFYKALKAVPRDDIQRFDPDWISRFKNRALYSAVMVAITLGIWAPGAAIHIGLMAAVGLALGHGLGEGHYYESSMDPGSGGIGYPDTMPRFHKFNQSDLDKNPVFRIVQSQIPLSKLPVYFNLSTDSNFYFNSEFHNQDNVVADFTLQSNVPISPLPYSYMIPLPQAQGYRIVAVHAFLDGHELRQGSQYLVAYERFTNLPAIKLVSSKQSISYEVHYKLDREALQQELRFPKLPAQYAKKLSQQLVNLGYTKIGTALQNQLLNQTEISFSDLARVVANNSVYTMDFPKGEKKDFDTHPNLDALKYYVSDGTYYGQCTGGDLLFKALIGRMKDRSFDPGIYFPPLQTIDAHSVSGFVRDPGSAEIGGVGHQHTLLVNWDTHTRLYVDATPGGDPIATIGGQQKHESRQQEFGVNALTAQLANKQNDYVMVNDGRTNSTLVYNPPKYDLSALATKAQRDKQENSQNQKDVHLQKLEDLRAEIIENLRDTGIPAQQLSHLPSTRALSLFRILKTSREEHWNYEKLINEVEKIFPGIYLLWRAAHPEVADDNIQSLIQFIYDEELKRRQNGLNYAARTEDPVARIAYDPGLSRLIDQVYTELISVSWASIRAGNQCVLLFSK